MQVDETCNHSNYEHVICFSVLNPKHRHTQTQFMLIQFGSEDRLMIHEQRVKQAVTDAAGRLTAVITVLMWRARSSVQDGTHLGATWPKAPLRGTTTCMANEKQEQQARLMTLPNTTMPSSIVGGYCSISTNLVFTLVFLNQPNKRIYLFLWRNIITAQY